MSSRLLTSRLFLSSTANPNFSLPYWGHLFSCPFLFLSSSSSPSSPFSLCYFYSFLSLACWLFDCCLFSWSSPWSPCPCLLLWLSSCSSPCTANCNTATHVTLLRMSILWNIDITRYKIHMSCNSMRQSMSLTLFWSGMIMMISPLRWSQGYTKNTFDLQLHIGLGAAGDVRLTRLASSVWLSVHKTRFCGVWWPRRRTLALAASVFVHCLWNPARKWQNLNEIYSGIEWYRA